MMAFVPRHRRTLPFLILWLAFCATPLHAEQIICPDPAAAKQGSALDAYYMGRAHDEGYCGFAPDKRVAEKWYHQAAEAGHMLAAYEMGETYFTGDGMGTDFPKARKWYLVAGGKGHGPSQLRLGFLYAEAHFEGLTTDYAKAEEWFLKAAEQNAGDARFRLGNFYANYKTPHDFPAAFLWMTRAAEGGHRTAMFDLARMYLDGKGTTRDEAKGMSWMTKAAEADVLQAQMALADIYAGKGDAAGVMKWTLIVARKDTASPFWLNKAGDLLSQGRMKNYPAARGFYERGAANDDKNALKRQGEI